MVEHSLGKGEVESSILSCSTIPSDCNCCEFPRGCRAAQRRLTVRPSPVFHQSGTRRTPRRDSALLLPESRFGRLRGLTCPRATLAGKWGRRGGGSTATTPPGASRSIWPCRARLDQTKISILTIPSKPRISIAGNGEILHHCIWARGEANGRSIPGRSALNTSRLVGRRGRHQPRARLGPVPARKPPNCFPTAQESPSRSFQQPSSAPPRPWRSPRRAPFPCPPRGHRRQSPAPTDPYNRDLK